MPQSENRDIQALAFALLALCELYYQIVQDSRNRSWQYVIPWDIAIASIRPRHTRCRSSLIGRIRKRFKDGWIESFHVGWTPARDGAASAATPIAIITSHGVAFTMPDLVLDADPRVAMGKKNRALRRQGIVPIHVYGLDESPRALQAATSPLVATIRSAGRTTPVTVKVSDGTESVTLIRDVAVHPVSGEPLHVDFLRVDVTQTVVAPVPVELINQDNAPGTLGGAGVVTQGIYEVMLEARPGDMPSSVVADCTVLVSLDVAIHASDLDLGPGVAIAGDPDERVAWIQPPRVSGDDIEGEEEAEAEAEATEGGDQAAEGQG